MFISYRTMRRWAKLLVPVIILIYIFSSRWFWRFFYPLPYRDIIFKYSTEYKVDPYLVAAIIKAESSFSTEAESYRGARGIMQIMPDTGKWAAQRMKLRNYNPDDLYKPETNIRIGCWYIGDLAREFGNDNVLVIAAYNAGRGNVRQWVTSNRWSGQHETVKDIPFAETRDYVERVLGGYDKYRWLYTEN